MTPGPATDRPIRDVLGTRAVTGPLLTYGLVTGILAVGAGAVASSPLDRLGPTRQLVSIAMTLVVAALATVFGSRILGWILSLPASVEAKDAGDDGRGHRDR